MLSEEIKNLVGQVIGTSVFRIEKESVQRFAKAVGETNPLYYSEAYAADSRYGSIIAPPGYVSSVWFWENLDGITSETDGDQPPGMFGLINAMMEAGYKSVLDSGIDYEFFAPVKVGDTLTASIVVKDMKERKVEEGSMVFLVTDTTYTNQNGEKVAASRWMTIHR